MNDSQPGIFLKQAPRLPLLSERGRAFRGLEKSSSPDLNERVRDLFAYLDQHLGFRDSEEGQIQQEAFNELVRYAYPEIMIDLADLVYVQHERPMVFLNFDHLQMNRQVDPDPLPLEAPLLNARMEAIFYALANTLKPDPELSEASEVVRTLSESYSFYLLLTRNFPWEDPLPQGVHPGEAPVLDVATGLAGFSLIHDWPETHPTLMLTDAQPFIVEGLNHFKQLTGRRNIEVMAMRFPDGDALAQPFSRIHVNKFLHHLQRDDRRRFLQWCLARLQPGGVLQVIDTDLEYQILLEAEHPEYRDKLMPGYLETLVRIEDRFCHHLVEDVRAAGFTVRHFDFHEYFDETDAYSHYPGDTLPLKFMGFELEGVRP